MPPIARSNASSDESKNFFRNSAHVTTKIRRGSETFTSIEDDPLACERFLASARNDTAARDDFIFGASFWLIWFGCNSSASS
jgi:hypothetical protein